MATRKTKQAPAPTAPAGKAPGVIAAIVDLLTDGSGGYTTAELYNKLVERFPDRATEKGGMRQTIQIQTKRLHAQGKLVVTSETIEGRGVVYSATLPAKANQ